MQKVCMEWDSLIILPAYKMIINIEVKSGSGNDPLKSAASQTNLHLSIFKRIFGSILSNEWKFVKAACTPNLELENVPCTYCKQFIVTADDLLNFITWIKKLENFCKTYKDEDYTEEYDNMLVGLIGFSSMRKVSELNKLIVDPHEYSTETEKLVTGVTYGIQGENNEVPEEYLCYMLTPEQINAEKCSSKFMILDGDYGTGKTLVLKERAKAFSKAYPNDKIAYMNLTGLENYALKQDNVTMMDLMARNDFKDYTNITIITCKDLAEHFEKNPEESATKQHINAAVSRYLKLKAFDHLFIDEFSDHTTPISSSNALSSNIAFQNEDRGFFGECKSFCVALKFPRYYPSFWIENIMKEHQPTFIKLKCNMRNSQNIVNIAHGLTKANYFSPGKNITGPKCYHYKNIYNIDIDKLLLAAFNKYFSKCPETPVVILFSQSSHNEPLKYSKGILKKDVNNVFIPESNEQSYLLQEERNQMIEEFLTNPKGPFFSSIEEFQGAQARNTIIFLDEHFQTDLVIRNMILRTMSFAIIISNFSRESRIPSIPGLVIDPDLHEYVHETELHEDIQIHETDLHKDIHDKDLRTTSNTSDFGAKPKTKHRVKASKVAGSRRPLKTKKSKSKAIDSDGSKETAVIVKCKNYEQTLTFGQIKDSNFSICVPR